MNPGFDFLNDFLSLFFPELCTACSTNLVKNESVICTSCLYQLPYTNFHHDKENRVARQFWGRTTCNAASAFLYFKKGSRVQTMMHQLKYNNKPEVALKLGELYGSALRSSEDYQGLDLIIPVPLHPARLRKRGYNQSEYFAKGLGKTLSIPVSVHHLKRNTPTETQTRKSRFVRYENMKDVFVTAKKDELTSRHILLVDDVITTGATLEACSIELQKIPGTRISIAAIAFTD